MKKILALVVIVIAIVGTYSVVELGSGSNVPAEYSVFTRGDTTGQGIWLYGDTYMSLCKSSSLTELMQNTANVVALQYSAQGGYDMLRKIMQRNNVAVMSSENVDGVYIVYGLSDCATGRNVMVGDKQVNIQLALRGNTITVGTPLIMGSY